MPLHLQVRQCPSHESVLVIKLRLGGFIGWKFVEKYPEKVLKFISISAPHPRVWLSHVMRSWSSLIQNRWLYECRLPFLPELTMVDNDLEIFDKRFRKWNSTLDLVNYSHFDKEAYKYTFSRPLDWQGPINYYRNLPLGGTSQLQAEVGVSHVEALFVVGNMDPHVGLNLVSQSAKYVDRWQIS